MKKMLIRDLMFMVVILTLFSFEFDKADGWFSSGSKPKSYDMGIDKGAGEDGKNVASIKSKEKKINGFGTLMQQSKPDKYFGKKLRMTCTMKSKDVKNWAGLWLRIDQANSKTPLSFDNMSERPIKGTTKWTKYEIVLDVPVNASNMAFGALLNGTGQIWFDNLSFEVVDNSLPSTGKVRDEPTNLKFDK